MRGKLVISLDFEMMWGVRDHRSLSDYGDAVLGERLAIPKILSRFEAAGIRATWATVGMLFARNRKELLEFSPSILPNYKNKSLSPYNFIFKGIGENENDDPFFYGRSLIDLIKNVTGQEIATHTFSHYYCLEQGESYEAFNADIAASVSIANEAGVKLSSIVFPRNQMTTEHVAICKKHEIVCFRGNQGGIAYKSRPRNEITSLIRGLRFFDAIIPITGRHSYKNINDIGGLLNIPASRFLRPYSKLFGRFHDLHIQQVIREIRSAAIRGETYHLWWHPHNMGRNTEYNLSQLDRIIAEFKSLQDQYGMESLNMKDFHSLVSSRSINF